jgi:hypothetical protein
VAEQELTAAHAGSIFFVVVAVVAATVLVSSVVLIPSGPGVTVTSGPTSSSVSSADGLRLTLQISSASVGQGGSVTINVTETNTNDSPLNKSASNGWAVSGLRMSECYSSVYPFGVAVYEGHYTGQNVSEAKPLNLYPLVPCPLLIRYISGYYFQPSSDMAVVLPGSGPGMAMASGLSAKGNYTAGSSLTYFAPGEYTVVAGDEWGSLAFLYFTVV